MSLVLSTLYNSCRKAQFISPFLCLLNYKCSKSLMTIFRQNDYPAKHHSFIVYGIQPASGYWKIVINDHNILGLWRVMLVKLSIQRDLVFACHCLYADIVCPGLLCCLCCSYYLHLMLFYRVRTILTSAAVLAELADPHIIELFDGRFKHFRVISQDASLEVTLLWRFHAHASTCQVR